MLSGLQILETCLYVDDLDAASNFYGDVLRLPMVGQQDGRHVFFRCGNSMLLIFHPTASADSQSSVPVHGARGPAHMAFGVRDEQIDEWKRHLRRCGIAIEKLVRWPQGGRSIYFRDPAGNSLEIASPSIWGICPEGEAAEVEG